MVLLEFRPKCGFLFNVLGFLLYNCDNLPLTTFLHWLFSLCMLILTDNFSLPQIEYSLGGSSEKGSHILPVASFLDNTIVWSNCTIVWYKCFSDATMVTWCHNSTIWCHNSSTMETQPSTGSIHDYLFATAP